LIDFLSINIIHKIAIVLVSGTLIVVCKLNIGGFGYIRDVMIYRTFDY